MNHKFTNTRGREAIVELSDADLHFVSAAAEGSIADAILDALCDVGLLSGETMKDSAGHTFTRTCPKAG